jgi:hypothetical protein
LLSPTGDRWLESISVRLSTRDAMNRADRTGDGNRRTSVGFALQILQRRLASSPAAIHRSLERRRKRLEERLREERLFRDGASRLARSPALPTYDPDEFEDVPGEEQEATEEQILDLATAAQTVAELEAEIAILKDLEERALRLKLSCRDAKRRELESILDEPIMLDAATGLRRKIISSPSRGTRSTTSLRRSQRGLAKPAGSAAEDRVPQGVCDYSRRGVEQQALAATWLSYPSPGEFALTGESEPTLDRDDFNQGSR